MKAVFVSLLLLAAPAWAQTSDDALDTIEGVTGLDWSNEAQAQTTLASPSDWARLRKALNAELGAGDKARGNQVLVWNVPDANPRFADTLSLVLEKSGSTTTLTMERRKPVRDAHADITSLPPTAPQSPAALRTSSATLSRSLSGTGLAGASRPED